MKKQSDNPPIVNPAIADKLVLAAIWLATAVAIAGGTWVYLNQDPNAGSAIIVAVVCLVVAILATKF